MMVFCWLLILSTASLLLEVAFGNRGLIFAGPLLLFFYITVAWDWKRGLLWGVFVCLASEVLFGRSITLLPLLPVLALPIRFWKLHGDRRLVWSQMLPAALIGLAYALYYLLGEALAADLSFRSALPSGILARSLLSAGLAAGLFPLGLLLVDNAARLMDLNRFGFKRPLGRASRDDDH